MRLMEARHIGILADKIHSLISDKIPVYHEWKVLPMKIETELQVSHILP
jgi:hypothetical protein